MRYSLVLPSFEISSVRKNREEEERKGEKGEEEEENKICRFRAVISKDSLKLEGFLLRIFEPLDIWKRV